MKPIVYHQMFNQETSHAWYLSTRHLLYTELCKHLSSPARILDAGCGTGGTIAYLTARRPDWKISGIDKSDYAINYCRRRHISDINQADISKLPFNTDYFDAVICLDVLYQKGVDKPQAVSEMARVLKPGGLLYLQEPANQSLFSAHDRAIGTDYRFDTKAITALLQDKFVSKKCSYFNFILFPLIAIRRLLDKTSHRNSSDLTPLSPALNTVLYFFLRLDSILFKYFDLPYGLSVIYIGVKR